MGSRQLVMLLGGPMDGEVFNWNHSWFLCVPLQGFYHLDFIGVTATWTPDEFAGTDGVSYHRAAV